VLSVVSVVNGIFEFSVYLMPVRVPLNRDRFYKNLTNIPATPCEVLPLR
jgi:hypothetical protein